MRCCLSRLDAALFNALLRPWGALAAPGGAPPPPRANDKSVAAVAASAMAADAAKPTDSLADPITDPRTVPGGGAVSISAMWRVTMVSQQLREWGARRGLCGKEEHDVFPFLKAAAAVVTMPKEPLMDSEIRQEARAA